MTVIERTQIIAEDFNFYVRANMLGEFFEIWKHKIISDVFVLAYEMTGAKDEIEYNKIWLARDYGTLITTALYYNSICFVCLTEEDLMQILGSLTDPKLSQKIFNSPVK